MARFDARVIPHSNGRFEAQMVVPASDRREKGSMDHLAITTTISFRSKKLRGTHQNRLTNS